MMRLRNPATMMKAGLICLIAANLATYFSRSWVGPYKDVTDGLTGFVWGLAFGLLLLSIWLRSRPRHRTC